MRGRLPQVSHLVSSASNAAVISLQRPNGGVSVCQQAQLGAGHRRGRWQGVVCPRDFFPTDTTSFFQGLTRRADAGGLRGRGWLRGAEREEGIGGPGTFSVTTATSSRASLPVCSSTVRTSRETCRSQSPTTACQERGHRGGPRQGGGDRRPWKGPQTGRRLGD